MFGDFLKGVKNSAFGIPESPDVDLNRFQDPVAKKCDWKPLKPGAANFNTHKLHKTGEDVLEYKPTPITLTMGIGFALAGVALLASSLFGMIDHWIVLVVGSIFLVVGAILFLQGTKPVAFDNRSKTFRRGRGNKDCTPFDQIHGIQILTKIGKVSSNSDSYQQDRYFYAYEMNLVMHDSARTHVMSYTNKDQVINDADLISQMTNAQIWNGIN